MAKTKLSVEELAAKVAVTGIKLETEFGRVMVKKTDLIRLIEAGFTRTEISEIYNLSMAKTNQVLKLAKLTPVRIAEKFILVDDVDYTTTPDADEVANTDASKIGPADGLDHVEASYIQYKGAAIL